MLQQNKNSQKSKVTQVSNQKKEKKSE